MWKAAYSLIRPVTDCSLSKDKSTITSEYLMLALFLFFFLFLGPDLAKMGGAYLTIQRAAGIGADRAALAGEMTSETVEAMEEKMIQGKLNPERYTLSYTKGQQSLGGEGSVTISGEYKMMAFRLFGWNVKIPMTVKKAWVSQVYVR